MRVTGQFQRSSGEAQHADVGGLDRAPAGPCAPDVSNGASAPATPTAPMGTDAGGRVPHRSGGARGRSAAAIGCGPGLGAGGDGLSEKREPGYGSFKRRAWGRPVARLVLLAGLVLAAGAGLLSPETAQAQSTTTLVSNEGLAATGSPSPVVRRGGCAPIGAINY